MKFTLTNTKQNYDKSKKSVYVEDEDVTEGSQQQSRRRISDESPKRYQI